MAFFEWILRHSNTELHQDIKSTLLLPEFILNIAKNRGIDSYASIMEFTFPQVLSLRSPFALNDMDKAIYRIQEAIKNKEKILIFGDKDADGVTSTAIIYRIITKFDGDISYRVPEGEEHYGISKVAIDDAKSKGISLIITVDCGITAVEEAKYTKELGIDLIISDHHEPLEALPESLALINPKLHDYPFPYLAGAGVALKIAQGLAESYFLEEFDQEFVCFDIETTGLDPENDEITEIAAIIIKNGIEIRHFQCLIKISGILDPKIIEITSITNEMLQNEGINIIDALNQFIEFIGERSLVGHNIIGFDMKFLQIQLQKHLQQEILNLPIDTLNIAKVMFKSLKSHTLFSVGEFLGVFVDHTKLHRALNDVRLNAEVYHRMILTRSRPIQQTLSELIPLAAIGTVADIMPLQDENRVIVHMGINKNNIKLTTTGLITLLRRLKLMDSYDSRAISWVLGPILNSPGRLGQAGLVVQLLIETHINKANELVDLLIKKDQERKELVSSLEEEIVISTNISNIQKNKHILIISDNIARGITGLIATKLANQFHVPVIIISKMTDGTFSGSIRSTGLFNIISLLQSMQHLFIRFGGHKSAGGFVIKNSDIPSLKEEIVKYMENWSAEHLRSPLDIDTELTDLSLLNIKNVNYIKSFFNPIGCANPFPNFLIKNISLVNSRYIGRNKEHMIFVFLKEKTEFNVIAWGFATRWNTLKHYTKFDLVGSPEINNWNNVQEIRLQLIDIDGKE